MDLLNKIISKPIGNSETPRTLVIRDATSLLDLATITDSPPKESSTLTSIEEHKEDILSDLLEDTLFFLNQYRMKTRQNLKGEETRLVEERLERQLDCFDVYGETARTFLRRRLGTTDRSRSKGIGIILSLLEEQDIPL